MSYIEKHDSVNLNQNKTYLSLAETCQYLNVGETTVYNYRKAGILVARKINRKLYFKRSELESLIERGLAS